MRIEKISNRPSRLMTNLWKQVSPGSGYRINPDPDIFGLYDFRPVGGGSANLMVAPRPGTDRFHYGQQMLKNLFYILPTEAMRLSHEESLLTPRELCGDSMEFSLITGGNSSRVSFTIDSRGEILAESHGQGDFFTRIMAAVARNAASGIYDVSFYTPSQGIYQKLRGLPYEEKSLVIRGKSYFKCGNAIKPDGSDKGPQFSIEKFVHADDGIPAALDHRNIAVFLARRMGRSRRLLADRYPMGRFRPLRVSDSEDEIHAYAPIKNYWTMSREIGEIGVGTAATVKKHPGKQNTVDVFAEGREEGIVAGRALKDLCFEP